MNLHERLHQISLNFPDKPALIFQGQEISYCLLDEKITRFAAGLAKQGIKQGDHIALLLGNSPEFVIALYGALRVGATIIPINPTYTKDELSYILQDGDINAIVTVSALAPLLNLLTPQLPFLKTIMITDDDCQTNTNEHVTVMSFVNVFTSDVNFVSPPLANDDVAVILYTSGTTGKPKGAMLTQKNLYHNALDSSISLQINDSDRVIAVLPMFHVFCLTCCLNTPLMCGATILIMPKFHPVEVLQLIGQYQVTLFAGVPTMYNYLLQIPNVTQEMIQSLRVCISGGAAMPVALLTNFQQKFGVVLAEGYGLSEASPVTCFNPIDRKCKAGSIGVSIAHVENRIVDENGCELPTGEIGELVVRGPNVMKGYYKLPEETATAIRDHWLYTGDMAYVDEEGYFFIVDRKKDLVIVNGFNVYPREIEEVLFTHPNVIEAAAIGMPNEKVGEEIWCYIVCKDACSADEMKQYCSEHLAKHKIPNKYVFTNDLPKNTTGKIVRRLLKEQALKEIHEQN